MREVSEITQKSPPQNNAGYQASLEALDRAFRASLRRYFMRRVRDRGEIDDMVQQVFERLLKRGGLDGIGQVGGYIFQIASSVLADSQRSRKVRHSDQHEEFDPHSHGDVAFSAEHVFLMRERLTRATAILLELPERTRVIFVLRRLEGMKYRDIAIRLGISVSAVEKHMERAVVRLAEGIDHE